MESAPRPTCAGAASKAADIALYDPKGFEKPEGFKFKFPFSPLISYAWILDPGFYRPL